MSIYLHNEPLEFQARNAAAVGAASASDYPGGPCTHMLVIMFEEDGSRLVLRVKSRQSVEELLLTISKMRDLVWPPLPQPEN